jgi:hypothetical protein
MLPVALTVLVTSPGAAFTVFTSGLVILVSASVVLAGRGTTVTTVVVVTVTVWPTVPDRVPSRLVTGLVVLPVSSGDNRPACAGAA